MYLVNISKQGWKISWYFRKYRKYPIFSIFLIFLIDISSICTYIAKIIWNLLPNNSMCVCVCVCVCALHIRWSTLVIHTALLWRGEIWQKLSNTEKMLRAQVINQQNTQTENQNVVAMCHIKKYFKNSRKIENIENIRYFRTKISDIYRIYINDIYRANPVSKCMCTINRLIVMWWRWSRFAFIECEF